MPPPITATIESMVNYPSHYEIWFRINGVLVGRGLMTFNDRTTAERFLADLLKGEFHD